MAYYVYLIECSNASYYTGYTTDIQRRYQEHCIGSKKCKYTRSFPPKKLLAYWEILSSQSDALKLEKCIKQLSKKQKTKLVAEETYLADVLQQHGHDASFIHHIQRAFDTV